MAGLVRLERLENLEAGTIISIWRSYFEKKPFTTGFAVSSEKYSKWIGLRARESPVFIIPLAIEKDFYNFVVHHQLLKEKACLAISTLYDYQNYGEAAPLCVGVDCFSELVDRKNIALLRSKFDGSILSRAQSDTIIHTCIEMYCQDDAYQWVQTFNNSPTNFDFDSFLSFFKAKFI